MCSAVPLVGGRIEQSRPYREVQAEASKVVVNLRFDAALLARVTLRELANQKRAQYEPVNDLYLRQVRAERN